ECFGGRGQSPRRPAVGLARPRIAARVIVREHDPGAAMLRRVGDDVAQRKRGAALIAVVAREVQAAGMLVDMGDPQEFAPGVAIGNAAGEESAGSGEPVEFEWKFGTLIPHAGKPMVLLFLCPFETSP